MLHWKESNHGKTALLIQGARRIGKSTIVKEFAKREYMTHILIDFSKASSNVMALFDDLSDLDYIFTQLQFHFKTQLHEHRSVIIFDEVQLQPRARQAIKHLIADGRYDYIETGSLISITKNIRDILIPSEETIVNMYPMDYEEFCWAMGDNATVPLLRTAFERRMPLRDAHRKLMRDFRLYMLVGGMPQAVETYLETRNLSSVDAIKRNIISLYLRDLNRLDNAGKAANMFNAIPAQLNKNASRYMVSNVIPGEKTSRVTNLVYELGEAMVANIAYHCDDPNVGLALTKDIMRYKIYACDTGLFVTLAFYDKSYTENIIYEKLLSDKLNANMGYVYENIVAQMLRSAGNELYYHTIKKADNKGYYEIDFLLSRSNKLCPIEVKSSGNKSHKSLDHFCEAFSNRVGSKYVISGKDLRKEGDVLYIPIYMTMFL